MGLMTVAAPAAKALGGAAFRAVLPRLQDPFTRRRVLARVESELLALCETPEQARDLYNRIAGDLTLTRISQVRTVQEVHQIVQSVIHPVGHSDPQKQEAALVLRSLLRSLLSTTAAAPGPAITADLILELYLAEEIPALSELLHDHRRRRKQPASMAVQDLALVLQHAGQRHMGVAVFADQPPQVIGEANVHLRVSGNNARLLHHWMQGGQGGTLTLTAEHGAVSVSYGNEELDRLLLPSLSDDVQYQLEEVKTRFEARVKVGAPGTQAVFVRANIGYGPLTKEQEISFGHGRCMVTFTLNPGKVNVRLNLDSMNRPYPLELKETLKAMTLLGHPEMSVLLPAGTSLPHPGQDGATSISEDKLLLDGRIWSEMPRDEPSIPDYLQVLAPGHLQFQKVAEYLADREGIDREAIELHPDPEGVVFEILDRAVQAIDRTDQLSPMDFTTRVNPELGRLMAHDRAGTLPDGQVLKVRTGYVGLLDLKACVVEVRTDIDDFNIHSLTEEAEMFKVEATGQAGNHRLTVHPPGSFAQTSTSWDAQTP